MNKKGFELSINMIVVIILSIVIIGFGIMIFNQIINKGYDLQTDLDKKTQDELDRLMDDGGLVVMPGPIQEANLGDYVYFPIGITNDFASQESFTITIVPQNDTPNWDLVFNHNHDIQSKGRVYLKIAIGVPDDYPLEEGQYGFIVEVKRQAQIYGNKKLVYVVIP
jgi:hypothetical protein